MAAPDLLTPLDRIVARHGAAVLTDRARITGLLRDHAPGELPAIRAFIGAFDLGIPERCGSLDATAVGRESGALAESTGCPPELARLALETWMQITAGARSASILPLPLPHDALAAVEPAAGAVQPLPGVQPLPVVQSLPGAQSVLMPEPLPRLAGMPRLQPAVANGPGPSRPGSRMILAGLLVTAIVVAAAWILRIMAS